MLDMNSNTIIIDKHSSSIQISNKITAVQRKSYNYMLKIAKNEFLKDKNKRIFQVTADELLLFFNFGSKNHSYIKKELEILNSTKVTYNFFGKNKKSKKWGSFTLIAGFEYDNGIISFSFPHQIEDMILKPEIFGKINLVTIKGLKSRYSIALYELAEDYINAQIPKMSIDDFREFIGVEKNQYPKFSMLKKHVIDVAIKEINDSENISFYISYDVIKKGRTTTHIKFYVNKKEEILQLKDKQKKILRMEKTDYRKVQKSNTL
jgi:plasmid replication initiation protein